MPHKATHETKKALQLVKLQGLDGKCRCLERRAWEVEREGGGCPGSAWKLIASTILCPRPGKCERRVKGAGLPPAAAGQASATPWPGYGLMAGRIRPGFPSIDGLADSHRLRVGNYPSRLAITGADCSEFVWVNQSPAGTPPERFAICLRDGPGTWPGACGQT